MFQPFTTHQLNISKGIIILITMLGFNVIEGAEVEAAIPVCRLNKYGFCKYKETCRMDHVGIICDKPFCDIKECSRRHPKPCSYFAHTHIGISKMDHWKQNR